MEANLSKKQIDEMMDSFINSCRYGGLKITHQRVQTYRTLLLIPDHPTVETIHKRMLPQLPTISLDTVYRTLTTLEEHHLVARIQTSESQARYEAVFTPHHHIICSKCKAVMDFEWPEVDQLNFPKAVQGWGRVNTKTIVIYGYCADCTSDANTAQKYPKTFP